GDFERPALTRALEERRVIQGTIMRSTIHTVSAADYWPMTIGVRRLRRAWLLRAWRARFEHLDPQAMADAARGELQAGPLRMRELVARLAARGFPKDIVPWVGHWVDLVRVPPSGTWERRRADLFGLAETWLEPAPVTEAEGIGLLVRRFLGAYGPAPDRDIAGWMGLPVSQVRPIIERLGLERLVDEAGKELLDLPGGGLPDPETPAPVRFLAVWDPVLLVHQRRTGILPEAFRPRFNDSRNPQSMNAFLIDGQVAGSWRYANGRIEVSPFRDLRTAERRAVEAEADRLAAFHT
ncbi:MAG: winged helix DNA-binding domain-containing protein, partial [Candidatus Limnocylindrales bacterium]